MQINLHKTIKQKRSLCIISTTKTYLWLPSSLLAAVFLVPPWNFAAILSCISSVSFSRCFDTEVSLHLILKLSVGNIVLSAGFSLFLYWIVWLGVSLAVETTFACEVYSHFVWLDVSDTNSLVRGSYFILSENVCTVSIAELVSSFSICNGSASTLIYSTFTWLMFSDCVSNAAQHCSCKCDIWLYELSVTCVCVGFLGVLISLSFLRPGT